MIGQGKVQNMMTGYSRTIPEYGSRGLYNLARFGAFALKDEARKAGLRHWGGGKRQLFSKQTRAVKIGKFVYHLVMPLHGKILDIGNYWISLKRGRLVTKWAMDKGIIDSPGGSIYVKPHPFIRGAVTRIIRKTKKIVEKDVNKAIRRKGR